MSLRYKKPVILRSTHGKRSVACGDEESLSKSGDPLARVARLRMTSWIN